MQADQIPAEALAGADEERTEIKAQLGKATQPITSNLQVFGHKIREGVIKALLETTTFSPRTLNALPESRTSQPAHPMTTADKFPGKRQHRLDMAEDRDKQQKDFSHRAVQKPSLDDG